MSPLGTGFLERAALSRIRECRYVGTRHPHARRARWLAAIGHLLALALCGAWNEHTVAKEIPERPKYPIKMDTLSDAEFGRMFFAEIDLEYPGLQAARAAVNKGDYTTALAEWSKVFMARMQALPLVPWSGNNWFSVDMPMTPNRVVLRHKVPLDFGPAGRMSWYDLKHWKQDTGTGLHVNFMWHTKAIIAKVEENLGTSRRHIASQRPYTDEELFSRWAAIWRDFVNNNWRIGMPLAHDPELRRRTLAEAGLDKEPLEWGNRIAFVQQAVVSWMMGNWFAETQHAIQASPDEFARYVSPRAQAEMVYFMVVWPLENLTDIRQMPVEKLAGGAPNQSQDKSVQLLRFAMMAPEFMRGQKLAELTGKLIKTILGVDGYFAATTDAQPDGSGTELSYNYMHSLINAAEDWLRITQTQEPQPDWAEPARRAMELRRRFYANLATPTGLQPLCKGPHSATSRVALVGREGQTPGYSSLAFPWHGLYMMRSGWGEKDLYLSLVNCRVGQGHAAEDATSIILEAHGRFMLVHNAGEGWGNSPYFGSSWAKNTVHVDGLAQRRCAQAPHGAYREPQDGRWHTSAHFDFAEGTYRYGYGPAPVDMRDKPKVQIADVTHTRQAIFVKAAALWFVMDIMNAPAATAHEYTQLWHFHKDFPQESVVPDAATQTIATKDAGDTNVFLYQAAPASLTYRKFHGEGWNATGDKNTGTMPVTVRGWHNTGGGYDGKDIFPAVDVHATWKGRGRQVVVTALVPSANDTSPVMKCERIVSSDRVGLTVELTGGVRVTCVAAQAAAPIAVAPLSAPAHALVMVEKPGVPARGLSLGPDPEHRKANDPSADWDFEFILDHGTLRSVAPIKSPSGFHWQQGANGPRPAYE